MITLEAIIATETRLLEDQLLAESWIAEALEED